MATRQGGDQVGLLFFHLRQSDKPFTTTNLTPKVGFSPVVLEGNKMVDVKKDVFVRQVK